MSRDKVQAVAGNIEAPVRQEALQCHSFDTDGHHDDQVLLVSTTSDTLTEGSTAMRQVRETVQAAEGSQDRWVSDDAHPPPLI